MNKKLNKSTIFAFIIGAVIFGVTSVLASNILASNIGFRSSNISWNVDNVNGALDDLYNKFGTINSHDCINGSYKIQSECLTSNGCVLFGGLEASTFMLLFQDINNLVVFYDVNIDANNIYYYDELYKGLRAQQFNNILGRKNNKIIMHDALESYNSKTMIYFACK